MPISLKKMLFSVPLLQAYLKWWMLVATGALQGWHTIFLKHECMFVSILWMYSQLALVCEDCFVSSLMSFFYPKWQNCCSVSLIKNIKSFLVLINHLCHLNVYATFTCLSDDIKSVTMKRALLLHENGFAHGYL